MVLYPDLRPAEAAFGRLMAGTTVRLTRRTVDTFSTITGEWAPVSDTTLWEGPALFRSWQLDLGRAGGKTDLGDLPAGRGVWRLTIPKTAPVVTVADLATGVTAEVTACARDAGMIGRRFTVLRSTGSALAVARRYVMVDYQPLPLIGGA